MKHTFVYKFTGPDNIFRLPLAHLCDFLLYYVSFRTKSVATLAQ